MPPKPGGVSQRQRTVKDSKRLLLRFRHSVCIPIMESYIMSLYYIGVHDSGKLNSPGVDPDGASLLRAVMRQEFYVLGIVLYLRLFLDITGRTQPLQYKNKRI